MYSMEEILARLQKGESDITIAEEMADTLNSAVAAYEKSQNQKKKEADANDIAILFTEYIKNYYPDYYLEMGTDRPITGENIDNIIYNANAFTNIFKNLPLKDNDKKNNSDSIISDFLKNMGL